MSNREYVDHSIQAGYWALHEAARLLASQGNEAEVRLADELKQTLADLNAGIFAKIRTGGSVPDETRAFRGKGEEW